MTFSSVLYLFFVCHAGTTMFQSQGIDCQVECKEALCMALWRCCGRQQKQRRRYSNEHPITAAKSHFCVAHTGAKLHSFDLKPLLTQLCR